MPHISADQIIEGLTFDDVLLVPTYSEVLPTPDYISTTTLSSRRPITLNIPVVCPPRRWTR